jgi:glyoxylase-like metal-dependent hydrolase (beta-lactamase superfamily II)
MTTVKVIKKGYLRLIREMGDVVAGGSSSVTLIESDKKIIVDTGLRIDRQEIIQGLDELDLNPKEIDFVVNTHPHGDHMGNNDLFEYATYVLNRDGLKVCKDVEMIYTPGHTSRCYSLLVHTDEGEVAIVGDLIALKEDIVTGRIPQTIDFNLQKENRRKIIEIADYIVPGHGDIFRTDEYKKKKRLKGLSQRKY